ncbi:hypothetical protein H4219_005790 [Mycoemilia scoparia]|uniref:Endonuclease/exonuclease/phosphatase domain-containing protein n=1 Tax=Mycoemilia scoparia TaxID=417184 RepID=A0A9W7ZUK6_9FUNG|nr:hypothetical protein H4219_005790 [Mycoemilia scoparia]
MLPAEENFFSVLREDALPPATTTTTTTTTTTNTLPADSGRPELTTLVIQGEQAQERAEGPPQAQSGHTTPPIVPPTLLLMSLRPPMRATGSGCRRGNHCRHPAIHENRENGPELGKKIAINSKSGPEGPKSHYQRFQQQQAAVLRRAPQLTLPELHAEIPKFSGRARLLCVHIAMVENSYKKIYGNKKAKNEKSFLQAAAGNQGFNYTHCPSESGYSLLASTREALFAMLDHPFVWQGKSYPWLINGSMVIPMVLLNAPTKVTGPIIQAALRPYGTASNLKPQYYQGNWYGDWAFTLESPPDGGALPTVVKFNGHPRPIKIMPASKAIFCADCGSADPDICCCHSNTITEAAAVPADSRQGPAGPAPSLPQTSSPSSVEDSRPGPTAADTATTPVVAPSQAPAPDAVVASPMAMEAPTSPELTAPTATMEPTGDTMAMDDAANTATQALPNDPPKQMAPTAHLARTSGTMTTKRSGNSSLPYVRSSTKPALPYTTKLDWAEEVERDLPITVPPLPEPVPLSKEMAGLSTDLKDSPIKGSTTVGSRSLRVRNQDNTYLDVSSILQYIPIPLGPSLPNDFTILTLNLWGAGSPGTTRTKILHEIRSFVSSWPSPPEIITFQECNSGESPADLFKYHLSNYQVLHQPINIPTMKHDLATLVSKDLGPCSLLGAISDQRYSINLLDRFALAIINAHATPHPSAEEIHSLAHRIQALQVKGWTTIVAGDLNIARFPYDQNTSTPQRSDLVASQEAFERLLTDNDLVDIVDFLHPIPPDSDPNTFKRLNLMTFRSAQNNAREWTSRIDYVLLPSCFTPFSSSSQIHCLQSSDHHAVIVSVKQSQIPQAQGFVRVGYHIPPKDISLRRHRRKVDSLLKEHLMLASK